MSAAAATPARVSNISYIRCKIPRSAEIPPFARSIVAPRYPLQLLIAQRQSLLRLMPEPIRLAHIKPSLLRHCYDGIKVSSALKLLPKDQHLP